MLPMTTKEQTKKKIGARDVMTIAAMMVLTLVLFSLVGVITLPFPFAYLYLSAGLEMFLCATFYLVVANRLNKHGIFMVWCAVYGAIGALGGYFFLLPYFVAIGVLCEVLMIGKTHIASQSVTQSGG
jgi:energy-coupling factor transport system substrate-specific component